MAVRYCATGGSLEDCSTIALARQLQALASSPYEARRDSAMLDASIIEVRGWVDGWMSSSRGFGGQVDGMVLERGIRVEVDEG